MDILTGEKATKQKLEYRYLRTISEGESRATVPAGADEDLFPRATAEVSLMPLTVIIKFRLWLKVSKLLSLWGPQLVYAGPCMQSASIYMSL